MSRRLQKEWDHIILGDSNEKWSLNQRNFFHDKVVFEASIFINEANTAYRYRRIDLDLIFPPEYPFKPPEVLFKTPVLHPYVNHRGQLCDCLFKMKWKQTGFTGNVRYCMNILYKTIVLEGSNFDPRNTCIDPNIQFVRDTNYVMFDAIIQRCMGHELPHDTRIEDRDNVTYDDIGTWAENVNIQNELNSKRMQRVQALFQGKYQGMQNTITQFMGIAPNSPFSDRSRFVSTYTLDKVNEPSDTIRLLASDGEMVVPKWSSIQIFQDIDDVLELPNIRVVDIKKVIEMCRPEKAASLRMFHPIGVMFDDDASDDWPEDDSIDVFTSSFQHLDEVEIFDRLITADYMGMDRLVIAGCLKMAHIIKHKTRQPASSVVQFKTYVSKESD